MRRRMIISLVCGGALCLAPSGEAWAARGRGLGGAGGSVRYAARVSAWSNRDDDTAWNAGFGGGPSYTIGSKEVATADPGAGPRLRGSSPSANRINYGSIEHADSFPPQVSAGSGAGDNPAWLLLKMSQYLAELQQLTMWITMTSERAAESGQKIQVSSRQITYLQRPDKLAVDVSADDARTRIFYDGTGVTVLDTTKNLYGTIAVQGPLDSVLGTLARDYGMAVPADDLLCKGAYARIEKKIRVARNLGVETLDGRSCYHVAFMGDHVDCQIWFQSATEPIPRKVVIIYKNAPGRPRCTLEITRWETGPVPASVFEPDIPSGAQQIRILPRQ